MIRALILSAAIAGLAGGLFAACYQAVVVTPLILAAEVFENAGETAAGIDLARHALTSLASVILATGGALILLGLMVLDGGRVTARLALNWGAAAFVSLALAPALGLPPELPGMPAADLAERQIWWLATVLATAFGLWMIFYRGGAAAIVLGALVIALPHIVGAPQPAEHDSAVPAALAAQFVAASLAGSALLWVTVSGIAGAAFARLHGGGDD